MRLKIRLQISKYSKSSLFTGEQLKMLDYCSNYIYDEDVMKLLINPRFSVHKMRILLKAYRKNITISELKLLLPLEDNISYCLIDTMLLTNNFDIILKLINDNFSSIQIREINEALGLIDEDKVFFLLNPTYDAKMLQRLTRVYMQGFDEEIEQYFIRLVFNDNNDINLYILFFKNGFTIDEIEYIKSLCLDNLTTQLLCNFYCNEYITKENILALSKEELLYVVKDILNDIKDLNNHEKFKDYNINLLELRDSIQADNNLNKRR